MTPVLISLEHNGKRPTVRGWAGTGYVTPSSIPDGANVGLRTDGIVIVDADTPEAAAWWREQPGTETPITVESPREGGGTHFYYRMPAGTRIGPSVNEALKLDIRAGSGSYALIPPSSINGVPYRWGATAWDFDPASLPEAPLAPVRSIQPSREEPADDDEGWDVIPEGRRNSTLVSLAGALRKQGAGAEAIAAILATTNAHRCVPPLDDTEIVAIVRSVLRYEPDPSETDGDIEILIDGVEPETDEERPVIRDARKLAVPPPPEWLHFPYLPAARLILLDGNEGIGKGMFATWAAVAMASGKFGESAPVIWGSTEDDPDEDILRRLLAAGYAETHDPIWFLSSDGLYWRYPADIGPLAGVVRETGARLLILDPGRSFLGPPFGLSPAEFSYNNEAQLRPGLEALNLLARKLDIAVLFIHHWNKNLTASIRVRSGGSAAFAQTVRHRVTLDYVAGQHALAVEKSNMTARENTVIGYELEEVEEFSTARFVWGAPYPAVDLDEWETQIRGTDQLTQDEQVDVSTDIVVDTAERELRPGGKFWNRDELREKFGLPDRLAKAVMQAVKDQGLVRHGPSNALLWAPRSLDA